MKYFFLLLIILISCSSEKKESKIINEVNVYTHRHYETDKKLFEQFEKETGIKINIIKADADQLIARIEQEGKNSPADLLLTVDAGNLWKAKEKGLTTEINSEILKNNIPSYLKDQENHWFGLTKRARVIVYSNERVAKEELSTYDDLTNNKWKKRILIRPSDNIYNQSLLASIIAHSGLENTQKWAAGLVSNFARKPAGNDRDQIKAIASGEGDIALVNTYYIAKMITSDDEKEREAVSKVSIFFPNQETTGTHINISGGLVLINAPNKENAIKLLEFLSSNKAQQEFSFANYEYPANPAVETSGLLLEWGEFKEDTLNLSLLGKYNLDAVKIFDKVKWN